MASPTSPTVATDENTRTRSGESEDALGLPEKESCVKHVDALWFCYSPVHQMQEYYRYGHADDCVGHWSKLYACLKKRTKFADQVTEEPKKHFLWTVRSKEEAAAFWQQEFHKQSAGANISETSGIEDPTDEKESVVI